VSGQLLKPFSGCVLGQRRAAPLFLRRSGNRRRRTPMVPRQARSKKFIERTSGPVGKAGMTPYIQSAGKRQ
jgi:hypothetical protein